MNLDIAIPQSEPLDNPNPVEFRTHSHMKGEFERLGCTVEKLAVFPISRSREKYFLCFSRITSFTSHVGVQLLKDKRATHLLLSRHGLCVAEQFVFSRTDSLVASRL